MANELGQPTAQEIAEKFCTKMLCNALLCEGCPVNEMIKAAQQNAHQTGGGLCAKCGSPSWAHGAIGHDFIAPHPQVA